MMFDEKTNISREALKKVDIYKTAAKVMGHFLNTSWTGARFWLKRSISKTQFQILAETCDKSRKNAKTIVFIASNGLLGYPKIRNTTFPQEREGVDAKNAYF